MIAKPLVDDLRRIVGKANVLDSPVDLQLYQYDAYLEERRPDAVVFVHSTEEVAGVDAVNPTSTGDGIRMALEHGAVVVNGDHMHGPIMRFVPPMRPKLIQRLPPLRWLTRTMRWSFDYLPAWLLRPFQMSWRSASSLARSGCALA